MYSSDISIMAMTIRRTDYNNKTLVKRSHVYICYH